MMMLSDNSNNGTLRRISHSKEVIDVGTHRVNNSKLRMASREGSKTMLVSSTGSMKGKSPCSGTRLHNDYIGKSSRG